MACKALEEYGEQLKLEAKIEIALKMIADDLSQEQIAKLIGFPLTKVQELTNEK